jgi:hypothetical protein
LNPIRRKAGFPSGDTMIQAISISDVRAEVKGSLVRGVVASLIAEGWQEGVLSRVSPPAAALVRDPPLATMWIDARLHNEILQAIYDIAGAEELRRLNQAAVADGLSPLIRAVGERVLSLFGASPASFLAQLNRMAGTTARGVEYAYEPIDATSGSFEVGFTVLRDAPVGAFVATAGALTFLFEMCGVRGTFGEPEWVPNGKKNRMRFLVSWRDRK